MNSKSHSAKSTLTELQERVLETLAQEEPDWILTGGAALAGFHLGHRSTRDLDLFWHGRDEIVDIRRNVSSTLQRAGLGVLNLRSEQAVATLQVSSKGASVVVDLVAEPIENITEPEAAEIGHTRIFIDSKYEILVNKLCALLHRSELRDLVDIEALAQSGLDLDRALSDAPERTAGSRH